MECVSSERDSASFYSIYFTVPYAEWEMEFVFISDMGGQLSGRDFPIPPFLGLKHPQFGVIGS
jgi:hypothetical protein